MTGVERGLEVIDLLEPTRLSVRSSLPTFFSAQQPAVQAAGQITGTVTDSDGAVVTGATIALESQLTHELNTSKSDGTGFFKFTALLRSVPGRRQRKGVRELDGKNKMPVKVDITWHPKALANETA